MLSRCVTSAYIDGNYQRSGACALLSALYFDNMCFVFENLDWSVGLGTTRYRQAVQGSGYIWDLWFSFGYRVFLLLSLQYGRVTYTNYCSSHCFSLSKTIRDRNYLKLSKSDVCSYPRWLHLSNDFVLGDVFFAYSLAFLRLWFNCILELGCITTFCHIMNVIILDIVYFQVPSVPARVFCSRWRSFSSIMRCLPRNRQMKRVYWACFKFRQHIDILP